MKWVLLALALALAASACGGVTETPSWIARGSCVDGGAVVDAVDGSLFLSDCGSCSEVGDGMVRCEVTP